VLRLCARLSLALLPLLGSAAAQEQAALLPLPQLTHCERASPPRLPERWRAVYLMAPFTKAQLVLGEIVHDGALSATRVRLVGVQRGSLDLLLVGRNTYVLGAEHPAMACRRLGDTGWRPLPQDWLQPQSACVGSAPLGDTPVDWWRTPIEPAPAGYWIWSRSSDGSPFRLVFPFPTDRLPPLSRYALSYQVSFEPLAQTDLATIATACERSGPARAPMGRRGLHGLIEGMSRGERAEAHLKRLMPTLAGSCPDAAFPRWPEQLAITGLMTPFDADEPPYPAEVLYDWSVPGQRTRIFGAPASPFAAQDSLLLDPDGYTVTHDRNKGLICEPVLPGTIRPDWPTRAPCDCAAVIEGTTPLSPAGPTRIMACPLASPRVAWAWYTLAGRPTVFMVTSMRGDEGKGLFAVLDYRDWLPAHRVQRSAFDKPAQCRPAGNARRGAAPAPKHCATCHLGSPRSAD
jgi:hypothetical protein